MDFDIGENTKAIQKDISTLRIQFGPAMKNRGIKCIDIEDFPNLNDVIEANMGVNDHISAFVSKVAGSIWFAYFLLAFVGIWMSVNAYIDMNGGKPFDAPYEFPILLFCTNFVQLLLPVFIVVNQQTQENREKTRAERDHLLMQMGKRDTLVMFSYLTEFAELQESIQRQLKINQNKLLAMEAAQKQLGSDIVPQVFEIMQDIEKTLVSRPCIMQKSDES